MVKFDAVASERNTLIRFALVGLINTVVGLSLIFLGLTLGFDDYAANAMGYGIGILVSYILNRSWTFSRKSSPSLAEFGRFVAAFALAYAANLAVITAGRAAAMSGNLSLHVAGLVVYSTLFYIFSRTFVFGGIQTSRINFRREVALHWPELTVVGVTTALAFFMRNIPLTHDVIWQLWIARQLLQGATLYQDIMELNPPLWFWSAMPVQQGAALLGVSAARLLVPLVLVGASVAALTTGWLAAPQHAVRRCVIMLTMLVVSVVIPIYDFGQREQLALICAIPYAALIASRHDQRKVPWHLAAVIGFAAAYGFALKHYFVSIPLGLELWLMAHLGRRQWQPFRPETLTLAAVAVIYAAAVLVFAPDFLTAMVPMVRAAYHGYENPWPIVLLRPWTMIWVCLAAFLWIHRRQFTQGQTPIVVAFSIVSAGFALAYLLQQKGWLYHSVPVTGALALAVLAFLALSANGTILQWIMGLIVVAMPFSLPIMSGQYHNFYRAEIDPTLSTLPKGEAVFIAAVDPMWGWPTVEDHGLVWRSRYYAYWMLPAIAHAEIVGPNQDRLRTMGISLRKEAAQELRCSRPALVMFEVRRTNRYQPASFDLHGFFMRSNEIRNFLNKYYVRKERTRSMIIYRREGKIPLPDRDMCPRLS